MKFKSGPIVLTCGVSDLSEEDSTFSRHVQLSLQRHLAGDWGNLCDDDRVNNEEALQKGERLFSSYEIEGQPKIWIITERDRSVTTVLFPSEY